MMKITESSRRNVGMMVAALTLAAAAGGAFAVSAAEEPPASPAPAAAQPAPTPAPAVAPAPAEARAGTQVWEGKVDLQVAKLDFSVALIEAQDQSPASGTLSIPMQGVKDAALQEVVFIPAKAAQGDAPALPGGMRLTFVFPGTPEAVFDMTLDAADANKASGTLSQAGQSFPVSMTRLKEGQAPSGPDRPQHPKPPFPYEVGEMKFPGGKDAEGKEISLAGTITFPKGDGPFPGVVLVSGSGPQDRDETLMGHKPFLVLADALTRAGVAVLRYDDRGVGASSGDFPSATTEDFASDAEAAWRALSVQPNIDAKRVGIIGHSEGGLIAPIVAARNPGVAFLVLMAGTGLDGKETLKSQLAAIQRANGVPEDSIAKQVEAQQELLQQVVDGAAGDALLPAMRKLIAIQSGMLEPTAEQLASIPDDSVRPALQGLDTPWMRTFLKLDPRPHLRKTTAPVLALNGELDTQVIASIHLPEIGKALDEAGNKDVTTLGVNGVNHLFQTATSGAPMEYAQITETISPGVLKKMTQWVRQRTGLEPRPAEGAEGADGAAPAAKVPEKRGEGD